MADTDDSVRQKTLFGSEPDRLLHQLVVSALTVFVLLLILLGALAVRHIWLQQHLQALGDSVEMDLEDLEALTDEIEGELAEVRETPATTWSAAEWDEMASTLDDVDAQLEALKEEMNDVAAVNESAAAEYLAIVSAEPDAAEEPADQIFTILVVLVGLVSIIVALLLGVAVRTQQQTAYPGSRRGRVPW